jgi:lysophospholipase L1-like esterase
LDNQNRDPLIQKHIINSGLNVIYIMDRINKMTLTDTEKEALFHDSVHLEIQGHALWGKIINDDLKKLLEK